MPRRQRAPKPSTATASSPSPLILNGWTFLAWPHFDARWLALIRAVAEQRKAAPKEPPRSPEATLLAALVRVLRDHIARDPNAAPYRLRHELAAWRRVKFLGRLRLFYRFSSEHRIIVLAWLNDETTLRKSGAATDPYAVFSSMLARGDVPDDWTALIAGAQRMSAPLPDAGSDSAVAPT